MSSIGLGRQWKTARVGAQAEQSRHVVLLASLPWSEEELQGTMSQLLHTCLGGGQNDCP